MLREFPVNSKCIKNLYSSHFNFDKVVKKLMKTVFQEPKVEFEKSRVITPSMCYNVQAKTITV